MVRVVVVVVIVVVLLFCLGAAANTHGGQEDEEEFDTLAYDSDDAERECALLRVTPRDTLHAHRWYNSSERTFVDRPVSQLQCIGAYCDPERSPLEVDCSVFRTASTRAQPEPRLEWQCVVVRPWWLRPNVQLYDVRPECRSTIDGSLLRLPSVQSVVRGHLRVRPAHTRIDQDDYNTDASIVAAVQHHRGGLMPDTLLLSSLWSEDEATTSSGRDATMGPPLECELKLHLRRATLDTFLALRQRVAPAGGVEAAATAAVSLQSTFVDSDDDSGNSDGGPTVAAEVCRITYRVRLLYPIAGVVSVLSIIGVIVVFFVLVVYGTGKRESRLEVARYRVARELQRYEEEVSARQPSTAAVSPPIPQHDRRSLRQRDRGVYRPADLSSSNPTVQARAQSIGLATSVDTANGMTLDEYLMRAEHSRGNQADIRRGQPPSGKVPTVPASMSAAQFARGQHRMQPPRSSSTLEIGMVDGWGFEIDQILPPDATA